MRKCVCVIALLLAVALLSSVTAFAEVVPLGEPAEQILELADFEAGSLPDGDSYTVVDGGDMILTVTHVQEPGLTAALSDVSANGYYTADFSLPDGRSEVFLTGLTRDNVDEIEQAIIEGYSNGHFALNNLGFLDTEKTRDEDGDDNMCWAAATANLLTYTGWGAQAGYTDPDDLFELYINSFENKGGHPYYAIGWFFNGTKNTNNTASVPVDYPNSGGYLSDYTFNSFAQNVDLQQTGAEGIGTIYHALRDGSGAAVNVTIFKGSVNEGGHSITCWGFVTDNRYPETDKAHYQSIIITDSDSDELRGVDRRTAKDVMSCFALRSYTYGGNDTYSFNVTSSQTAIITDGVLLKPYRADYPRENAPDASRNRRTTADLLFREMYLTSEPLVERDENKFAVGDHIYYNPYFINMGERSYSGNFTFSATVTDASGTEWYTRSINVGNMTVNTNRIIHFNNTFQVTKSLPVGDYTMTVVLNPSHAVNEAYYFNNTIEIPFKVRETYLLGDFSGDGDIEVIDTTLMQRLLAKYGADLTDVNALRGDVNGSGELDIMDVTLLQRYLVYIETGYPVGSAMLYD